MGASDAPQIAAAGELDREDSNSDAGSGLQARPNDKSTQGDVDQAQKHSWEEHDDTASLVTEDTDGRALFEAASRYDEKYRKLQKREGFYLGGLLAIDLIGLSIVGLGSLVDWPPGGQRFALLGLGGLLGGLVYGGKWLYHAIAKGLWHEDRQMWRYLSPWISVATTIGIWALMDSGFFPSVSEGRTGGDGPRPVAPMVGVGFVIGYLSDQFLAKMRELTEVLFGQSERHHRTEPDGPPSYP